MPTITLYTGAIGLNNKITPERLLFDPKTGINALEEATDVLIDRSGAVTSRRGMTEVSSGDYHSLFPGKDWGLVAMDRTSDTAIYRIDVSSAGTATLTGVQSGFTKGAWFDFCRVHNAIFYTNGIGMGMITDACDFVDWKESAWPTDSTVNFVAPPISEHLCYNAGRIYLSRVDPINDHFVINYTEFGHLGLCDEAIDGEQFPSRILAMVPATDGLYVSDQEAIYFLAGLDPHKWTSRKVTDYPAKEWGKFHKMVNPSFFGLETNIPSSVLATENGPVICLPSGQIVNLIEKNITMPDCPEVGAIAVFDETLIIQTGE